MEWQANWEDLLQRFYGLMGDARTRRTFRESIKGILVAGTLICQRIAACSPLLSQAKDGGQRIRRLASGERLVQVVVPSTLWEPWLRLPDWPVEDEGQALRIFVMYRQHWAVEDSFKVTKEFLGWEVVQMLDLCGIRTLVALAWVAAGFLYQFGVTLEWAEMQLLAKLGGWAPHKDRRPGKITLMRGLHRLLDMLPTQAFLTEAAAQSGGLPANTSKLCCTAGNLPTAFMTGCQARQRCQRKQRV